MRIALLTLEALAAAAAVRRFVAAHPDQIALVGLSDVHRPNQGDAREQGDKHLRRSGRRILPYLYANFTVPALARRVRWLFGRGDVSRRPLGETCSELGVPFVAVADVNSPGFLDALARSGAELIVCFHFDQILDSRTIAAVPGGAINVHAALLPHHRGPVPTIHALMEEVPAFGVTIHRVVTTIDAGPILAQAALDLPARTSAVEAARRLHDLAGPLLAQVIADIAQDRAVERPVVALPYCGWPSAAQLEALARRGRATARLGDFIRALRTPT